MPSRMCPKQGQYLEPLEERDTRIERASSKSQAILEPVSFFPACLGKQ